MQYALMELNKEVKIIMDVVEIEVLDNHQENTIFPVAETGSDKIELVYGSYLPQPDQDDNKVKEMLLIAKGYALGYIENNTCRLFELLDIRILNSETLKDARNRVPFVALVKGLDTKPTKARSISAFLRFDNMIVENNIINRYGIYAIETIAIDLKLKDAAITEQEWLEHEKWTTLIDWELLKNKYVAEEQHCHHSTEHTFIPIIEELKYTDNILEDEILIFSITHTYSDESKKYYIKAPYSYEILDALIAYIQFVSSDIDEHFGLYEEDTIKILSTFYDCTLLDTVTDEDSFQEIDLYVNWESWASEYKEIMEIKQFHRTGLLEFLKEIILEQKIRAEEGIVRE